MDAKKYANNQHNSTSVFSQSVFAHLVTRHIEYTTENGHLMQDRCDHLLPPSRFSEDLSRAFSVRTMVSKRALCAETRFCHGDCVQLEDSSFGFVVACATLAGDPAVHLLMERAEPVQAVCAHSLKLRRTSRAELVSPRRARPLPHMPNRDGTVTTLVPTSLHC